MQLQDLDDRMWRIPADTPAWKHIEDERPSFKTEPRNLRLGLGMDGVNPHHIQCMACCVGELQPFTINGNQEGTS